jgi:TPR repeat protein
MSDITVTLKKAEEGDARSQYNLGVAYFNGQGVPQDYALAFFWHSKAAEQGHAQALSNLGLYHASGFGVPKDFAKAISYYQTAIELGVDWAINNLGALYANGEGVAKDEVEAYAYYNIAGITIEEARTNRNNLEKTISREEIAAGQRRTKELQKEIAAKIEAKKAGK